MDSHLQAAEPEAKPFPRWPSQLPRERAWRALGSGSGPPRLGSLTSGAARPQSPWVHAGDFASRSVSPSGSQGLNGDLRGNGHPSCTCRERGPRQPETCFTPWTLGVAMGAEGCAATCSPEGGAVLGKVLDSFMFSVLSGSIQRKRQNACPLDPFFLFPLV